MSNFKIIFESENIYYIQVNELLINDYLKMVNDPEVQKGISHRLKQYTYEQELEWVKMKLEEKANIFTMIEKTTSEFIGNIEIMHIVNGIGEIGITITRNKQNHHYGQEAMKAIMDYGYDILNLDGFELNVYKTNPKAIHCYEKVGFVVAGTGKTDEDILMVYNKPKLIQYTPNDYEFVYQVKKEVYQKYVEECFGTWDEELQRNLYNQFIETEKDNLYIIQLNGKDIGFYNGKTLEDESYEIGNICIIPEYQGKGIGTQILTDIIKLHKEQDLHLQYFKQNPVGKLYEKLGFVHDYEKKFHYVMVKLK